MGLAHLCNFFFLFFHFTCFLTLFLPFLVIPLASLFLLLQRDEQLFCSSFLCLSDFLLASLSLLLLTFLGAKDKMNWSSSSLGGTPIKCTARWKFLRRWSHFLIFINGFATTINSVDFVINADIILWTLSVKDQTYGRWPCLAEIAIVIVQDCQVLNNSTWPQNA